MSESNRTFKIQVHPIIEDIVIEDLDGEITGNDILDKYAAVAAKKYNCKEKDIRDTLKQVIPFTPVGPAPDDSQVSRVGQAVVRTTRLKNMYGGKQTCNEINKNKGLCLVSVSEKHPIFNLVHSYEEELQRRVMLEAKVAALEKAMTEKGPLQASSNVEQPDQPKKSKKKKKRSKATVLGVGNTEDDEVAPDDPNTPTDPLASTLAGDAASRPTEDALNIDDDALDTSTLLRMLMNLREEMGTERAARLELEKVVHSEKEKIKELLAEQETMKNQIAAEKSRAVELEDWVSTQDPKFLDRIRLRALLDNGQSVLAHFIGCSVDADVSAASMAWRIKLNGASEQKRSDKERLLVAHELLSAQGKIPDQIRKLLVDYNAMRLLTQKSSTICRQGNEIAHRLVDSSQIAARSLNSADKDGMISILEFIDSYRV